MDRSTLIKLAVASSIAILIAALSAVSVALRSGERDISAVENIDGIPYPQDHGATIITEKLAHADIYLREPVIAKKLTLTITFTPHTTQRLSVGIRENAFWLSYPKYEIYRAHDNKSQEKPQTVQVTIPLTDKLKDANGSIDLMLFAEEDEAGESVDEKEFDTTLWELTALNAKIAPSVPSWLETKDFLKSILTHEKPV